VLAASASAVVVAALFARIARRAESAGCRPDDEVWSKAP